jgi:hypothetical protein
MDETAYRQTLTAAIPRNCPFEKTILTHCAACVEAEKHNIAEREVVSCNRELAHERCNRLRELLRHNFVFALGKLHINGPLPHAQEMRMQCGGMRGIQFQMDGNDEVRNVSELLAMAERKYGGLEQLPFSEIIKRANAYYKAR